MTHEVYIARLDGDVLYVGEGVKGRHQHVNSGVSNVYELNRLHFQGKVIDVEVIECNSKKEADNIETRLILNLKPLYNVNKSWLEPYIREITSCFRDYEVVNLEKAGKHIAFMWSLSSVKSSRLSNRQVAKQIGSKESSNHLQLLFWYPNKYVEIDRLGNGVFEVKGFKVTPKELRSILRQEIAKHNRKHKRQKKAPLAATKGD